MNKKEVIIKIKKYCKEYNIKEPNFNDYNSVKNCAEQINQTCPVCKMNKGKNGIIICFCELGISNK